MIEKKKSTIFKIRGSKNRRDVRKIWIISGVATLLFVAAATMLFFSYRGRVYKKCIFEAGVEVQAEDFLKDTKKKVKFAKNSGKINSRKPGEYTVKLKSGWFTYKCTAVIQDTIAPTAQPADVFYEEGKKVEPKDFVKDIQDVTNVTLTYEKEPDFAYFGQQEVIVILTDEGKNQIRIVSRMITRLTKESMELEAGDDFPELKEFLKNEDEKATFITDVSVIDTKVPGAYEIEILAGEQVYITHLKVRDTQAPEVQVRDISIYNSETLKCEDFIVKAKDKTAMTYAYEKEPDVRQPGEQPLVIIVRDAGGNETRSGVKLTILEDTAPPVIEGAVDIVTYRGVPISYKSEVTVKDDHDKNVKLEIDSSAVDVNTCGEYPVIYKATDGAGNQTIVRITVTIMERVYTEGEINQLADGILAQILTPDMTPYDKLFAIYGWTHNSIAYVGTSEKSSFFQAAFDGITTRRGDCYTYACVSKVLLTRAGIENRDIEKIPGKQRHYWNLVNIGEGWYHFDATPRMKQPFDFCYITDAILMEYSNSNGNSHNYDRNIYTDIQ